jgi:hypothetical protein
VSVATVLSTVGNDLKSFYAKLSSDVQKAQAAWQIISSAQTRSVLLTLGTDAIKAVNAITAASAGGGLSLTLDEAVVAAIQQLIADAKSGDGVIQSDLKALGVLIS